MPRDGALATRRALRKYLPRGGSRRLPAFYHSSVCTGGKVRPSGVFPVGAGSGAAADGPIVTTLGFAGARTAAEFCSGFFARAAAGRDGGAGGCEFDRPINLGGRGGATSPNVGENNGSADAALEPSATRLITKITRIFTHASRSHALNRIGFHSRPRLRQGLGGRVGHRRACQKQRGRQLGGPALNSPIASDVGVVSP